MTMKIVAALAALVLGLVACDDDGASVRDLGGSASSGSGSGSGTGPGSGTEAGSECLQHTGEPGITVTLSEFAVVPAEDELTPGPNRFVVANAGEIDHELYVAQAPQVEALPLTGEEGVDEEALRPGQIVAEIEEVPAGETCVLEVDLEPTTYVLFCNIVDKGEDKPRSHFLRGMRARVKVS